MNQNMEKPSIERIAFHEAGHILIHLLTGIKIREGNIIENDKHLNVAIHDSYDLSLFINNDLNDCLIMCLRAGSLAEKYYCWYKCINYDPQMSGNDLWQISRLFYEGKHKFTLRKSFEDHIKSLEEETDKLLKMNWPFIKIIAKRLLVKKRLAVEEISELWKHFQSAK